MKHTEAQAQRAFIKRVRMDARTKDLLLFAIPNGGKRGIREAALMKAEGVLRGVPDLFLAEPNICGHGMFIEFKSEKGTVKPHQKAMLKALFDRGYEVVVVRNQEEAFNSVLIYMGLKP